MDVEARGRSEEPLLPARLPGAATPDIPSRHLIDFCLLCKCCYEYRPPPFSDIQSKFSRLCPSLSSSSGHLRCKHCPLPNLERPSLPVAFLARNGQFEKLASPCSRFAFYGKGQYLRRVAARGLLIRTRHWRFCSSFRFRMEKIFF